MSFFVNINHGSWWNWLPADAGGFPNQKVAFSAFEKIIYVNEGVRELDVKIDIYSAWKEWYLSSPEYPYASASKTAISAIGGEPLNDTLNVGSTFFLENGWRIQPFPETQAYLLTVNGNLYTREVGENPFLFASGANIIITRSNLVDQLVASSTITAADIALIASNVWEYNTANGVPTNSYGQLVQNIDSDLTVVNGKVDKTLTTGEFLALK
jgi:hypothetical protein